MKTLLIRLKASLEDWFATEPYRDISDELELERELRRGPVGG